MIDLGRLEERSNSERQFRQQFLANPVSTLLKEGLVLSGSYSSSLPSSRIQYAQPRSGAGLSRTYRRGVGRRDAQMSTSRAALSTGSSPGARMGRSISPRPAR
jgi:hypothetical protein